MSERMQKWRNVAVEWRKTRHVTYADTLDEVLDEVERLLMSRARKDAMLAVYMQAIATRARSGEQEWAQQLVRRADEAALRVKRNDLTVATVSAEAREDGDE